MATNFLEFRSRVDLHDSAISSTRPKSDDEEFVRLVREVFDHQRAVFLDGSALAERASRAKAFYANYAPPYLAKGTDSEFGTEYSKDEIFKLFFLSKESANRNNVFFLIGDVGVGKSSFVNWMITEKAQVAVDRNQSWFVRIDLERICGLQSLTYEMFLKALAHKAYRILRNHKSILSPSPQAADRLKQLERSIELGVVVAIENALCELTREVQLSTGRRLTLVIDNVDYLCHLHDERLFGDGLQVHDDAIITFLLSLISNLVNHQNEAGQLGANVLFVMRRDSLRLLRMSLDPESLAVSSGLFDEERVFTLKRVPWKTAFEKRIALLEREISMTHLPGKKKKFQELTDMISASFNGRVTLNTSSESPAESRIDGTLSGIVVGLSVKGLRELVEFFGDYVWISQADSIGETLQRFIHQVPVGLLAYVLGGKRLYSESGSKFPNIWITTLRNESSESFQSSFLLKRAIVSLVRANGHTPLGTIYDVFGQEGGYSKELLERALTDLADAQTSRVLVIDRERVQGSNRFRAQAVRLSDRGILACESVFRRFFYLQLIVDDPALPIPLCLLPQFSYVLPDGKMGTDYRYIAYSDAGEYSKAAKHTITRKAAQVAMLLVVLEETETLEKQRFAGAFERLQSIGCDTVPIRDVRESIRHELRSIALRSRIDSEGAFEAAERQRELIRSQLQASYLRMFGS